MLRYLYNQELTGKHISFLSGCYESAVKKEGQEC